MRTWTLQIIIKHFDAFLKDVDFAHLPKKESEEYRQLVLKTANDVIFSQGRYSQITEWTLEMFDVPEVCALVRNLTEINQLTDAERMRLSFYMDVKEVCYPLFRAKKVDWTAWPWQLDDESSSLENPQLFDLIYQCVWPCLSAAILYNLKQRIWMDEEGQYSSVACQDASDLFEFTLEHLWKKHPKTDEDVKELVAAVTKCADDLWSIENHILMGRLLGFDQLTQSVYDAFDTFVDTTYRHNQVLCARELADWIRANWKLGERHPAPQKVEALNAKVKELMEKYNVSSPDERFSWNILTLDVLGMAMFTEKEENATDDLWMEDMPD